jgi:predicted alpha/beta-fold hydrolase
MRASLVIPPFRSHRLWAGGHRQTLAGAFLPGTLAVENARPHRVDLNDGEAVSIHDDQPLEWIAGGPTVVMVHGLAGCHRSGYLVRIAAKLNARGVRTFRMNLRGSGSGAALAMKPYHGGCSDDVAAVVRFVERLCPGSPTTLLGFSLGGNIVLKLLGEAPEQVPPTIVRAAAVNPPIDLEQSVVALQRWSLRPYDRYFVRLLLRRLSDRRLVHPNAPPVLFEQHPRRLFDFDNHYTAPSSSFRDAHDYYEQCSSQQFLAHIRVPTLILTSRDDPLIDVSMFERQVATKNLSTQIQLHIAEGGGHLGYLARSRSGDPDERWLDWRMVDWTLTQN